VQSETLTKPAQPLPLMIAIRSRFGMKSRLNEPRYKLFWQTIAVASSMLIFTALRPSKTVSSAVDTTQSTMIHSSPKGSRRTISRKRPQRAGVSKAREAYAHSMAKDFTNHLTLREHDSPTMQKSETTGSVQVDLIPTLIVPD
jgi:hypothetical protein